MTADRPKPRRTLGRWTLGCLANLALLAVTVLVAIGLSELLVRLIRPQQLRHGALLYQPVDSLGYEHRSNLDVRVNTGQRTVRVRTDREGYRIGEDGRIEASTTVLVLGDSFMEAIEVEYEESLAGLLQASLPAAVGRPVAVRNAGASGYEPGQYLAVARRVLGRQRVDALVVAIYTGNDIVDTPQDYYPPRERSPPLRPRWPRRWSMAGFARQVVTPLMLKSQQRSHLAVLVWNSTELLRVRLGMWEWGFPRVMLRERANGPEWAMTADICAELVALATSHRVPIRLLVIPQFIQMDADRMTRYATALGIDASTVDIDQPNRRLVAALQSRELESLDLLDPLRQAHMAGVGVYGDVDRHFTAAGHRLAADLIEPWLVEKLTVPVAEAATPN